MLRTTFILAPQRAQGAWLIWSSPIGRTIAENKSTAPAESRRGLSDSTLRLDPLN